MSGSDTILSVYSDARSEYTKQLCGFLVPSYFQFYIDLLEKAKQQMASEPKKALWQFQNLLNEIPDWNMEKVNQEIQNLQTKCGCDYLEDLLTAVFIAHTKVLTAIRISSSNKKVDINIPKVEHFLFRALCETAKMIWGSTYLLRDGIPSMEKQQNYRSVEGLLYEGITQAVRSMIPVKSILKDFMTMDTKTSAKEEDSDEEADPVPSVSTSPVLTEPIQAPAPAPVPAPAPIVPEPIQAPAPVPTVPEPIQAPTPAPTPVSTSLPVLSEKKDNNEDVPTIVIDDKPSVHFGQYDAVFDSDHPDHSDMIYDPKDMDPPEIEIMEDDGVLLVDNLDVTDLAQPPESLAEGDFEEL